MSRGTKHRWVAVFLLGMVIAHAIVFWQQRVRLAGGYGDFSALYTAGLMARRGLGHQLYDRSQQLRVQQEFSVQAQLQQGTRPFIRPPFEALLFVPFSYLRYSRALAAWSAVKLVLLALALWTLPRNHLFPRLYPVWLETILSLGYFPVFFDFFQGQDAVLLLLLLVLAFRSLGREGDGWGGVLLGLGLFKFHLIIPIVVALVLAGRPRVLAGFVSTALVLLAISCGMAGPAVLYSYPAYLLTLNRTPGMGMVAAQNMPNLRGLLTAWVGTAPFPGPIHWTLLPLAVFALAYVVWLWRSRNRSGFPALALGYGLTILVTVLTSYYSYVYDMTLLLVPMLLAGGRSPQQPQLTPVTSGLIRGGALLLLFSPLYWLLMIRLDRPYLLAVPPALLGLGLVRYLRNGWATQAES